VSYPSLDAFDRKILAILQREGRMTNARLSELVNLSPSACLARHRRLEEAGIIRGYRAEIALDRLRSTIRVLLQIKLGRHLPEDFRNIEKLLHNDPRVIEAAEISGDVDYFAIVCVDDVSELRSLIEELTIAAPFMDSVKSFVVLHATKPFAGVVLEARAEAWPSRSPGLPPQRTEAGAEAISGSS
jgi:DNA-binding Lrp family transcriptional regulator